MKKRVFSLLLAALLCLSLLPAAACAETEYEIRCDDGVVALVNGEPAVSAPAGALVFLSLVRTDLGTPSSLSVFFGTSFEEIPMTGYTFRMPEDDVDVWTGGFEDWSEADNWNDVINLLDHSSNVILTADVTCSDENVGINESCMLDLNGFCLDVGSQQFSLNFNDPQLTILDGSPAQTGRILCHDREPFFFYASGSLTLMGGSIEAENAGEGEAVRVPAGARFTMIGGSVVGWQAGVDVESGGSFTMAGGSIRGCGDGVFLDEGASFTMTDGSIRGCENGVVVMRGASFTMTGGSIRGCDCGAKVVGSFSVSGRPVIADNGDPDFLSNVSMEDNLPIRVEGPLTDGAALGVHLLYSVYGVFAAGGGDYALTGTDLSRFFSDAPELGLRLNEQGEAELFAPPSTGESPEEPPAGSEPPAGGAPDPAPASDPAPDPAPALGCGHGGDCPLAAYPDLEEDVWYHDGVHYVLENGLMPDADGGGFAPEAPAGRTLLAELLWALEGRPAADGAAAFSDLAEDDASAAAVQWCAGEGILNGVGDGRFGVGKALTREQLVAALYRYACRKGMAESPDTNILDYTDALEISPWAVEAFRWAVQTGLVNGVGGGRLAPKAEASRAMLAALVLRFEALRAAGA